MKNVKKWSYWIKWHEHFKAPPTYHLIIVKNGSETVLALESCTRDLEKSVSVLGKRRISSFYFPVVRILVRLNTCFTCWNHAKIWPFIFFYSVYCSCFFIFLLIYSTLIMSFQGFHNLISKTFEYDILRSKRDFWWYDQINGREDGQLFWIIQVGDKALESKQVWRWKRKSTKKGNLKILHGGIWTWK